MRSLLPLAALLMPLLLAEAAWGQSPEGRGNGAAPGADVPQNVVLMIADGAGPATFTMARDFRRWQQGQDGRPGERQESRLALDALKIGSVQTFSEDSRVTDSAAGATAFSTGHKTQNGFIAVDSQGRPLATILEAAVQRGMATGLVATSRLTHATPASFAAHTSDRWKENLIARQMVEAGVDLMLGGGRRHFLPQADAVSERTDDRDLVGEAEQAGYTVVTGREGLARADALPLLGLFADGHMDYVIDRDSTSTQPRLEAMTERALRLLSQSEKGRENGVFLMVEGSRIDHAGHSNDAAAHLREALAYDAAVAVAKDFADSDGETLLLSTADHETGGLSLGRNVDGQGRYFWHPSVLAGVRASQSVLFAQILDEGASPVRVLGRVAGINDLTQAERRRLNRAVEDENYGALEAVVSEIIGRRAVVGWTSGGHTAVDVGLYGTGPGAGRFAGHHDNTFVGAELARLMGADLGTLTAQMRKEASGTAAQEASSGE